MTPEEIQKVCKALGIPFNSDEDLIGNLLKGGWFTVDGWIADMRAGKPLKCFWCDNPPEIRGIVPSSAGEYVTEECSSSYHEL